MFVTSKFTPPHINTVLFEMLYNYNIDKTIVIINILLKINFVPIKTLDNMNSSEGSCLSDTQTGIGGKSRSWHHLQEKIITYTD